MSAALSNEIPRAAGTGTIHGKTVTCRYSIFQPAVTQWVAIGVVSIERDDAPQLAVGTASNPKDALAQLQIRVAELSAEHDRRDAASLATA